MRRSLLPASDLLHQAIEEAEMKTLCAVLGLAMVLTTIPAEAKKAKTKTVTGCVEASNNQYDLSTVTAKKGKPRHYAMTGSQNFATEVGHRVRVTGLFGKSTVKVAKMEQLATSCH
jgi:hypothetical protein